MIPRINVPFLHRPLPPNPIDLVPKVVGIECMFGNPPRPDTEKYEKYIHSAVTQEETVRRMELYSSCKKASCPWARVARMLKTHLDTGIPCTNAFCKMYEMCYDTEVRLVLDKHGRENRKISIVCLAEAPGTFPIAIAYFFGVNWPGIIRDELFEYICTTLYLDTKDQEALQDQYSLIGRNAHKWHFMNHTSVPDTRRMIKSLGAGAFDLATGDIGKPSETTAGADRSLYLEQLGQLISALALLRGGGAICLKMFNSAAPGQVSMLRLAMGVFELVRIYKPRTSHTSNRECYWIGSGFKRALFEPLLEDMLKVLENGMILKQAHEALIIGPQGKAKNPPIYPPFLRTISDPSSVPDYSDADIISTISRMSMAGSAQRALLVEDAKKCITFAFSRAAEAGGAYGEQLRRMGSISAYYSNHWLSTYPISPLGGPLYKLLNMDPGRTPTSVTRAGGSNATAPLTTFSDESDSEDEGYFDLV